MDQYQRISFVIAVISGAGFLAYVAADDIFLSFAQKHSREDLLLFLLFFIILLFIIIIIY